MGDSITEDPAGYVSLIRAALGESKIRVINAGVGGNKVRDLLARLESDVFAHSPDWLTVSIGINDVWHRFYDWDNNVPVPEGDSSFGSTPDQFRSGLEELVDRVRAAEVPNLIFVEPTIIGETDNERTQPLEAYVQIMRSIAEARKVEVCPMHDGFKMALADGGPLTTDGVHMNEKGARIMAEILLRTLGY